MTKCSVSAWHLPFHFFPLGIFDACEMIALCKASNHSMQEPRTAGYVVQQGVAVQQEIPQHYGYVEGQVGSQVYQQQPDYQQYAVQQPGMQYAMQQPAMQQPAMQPAMQMQPQAMQPQAMQPQGYQGYQQGMQGMQGMQGYGMQGYQQGMQGMQGVQGMQQQGYQQMGMQPQQMQFQQTMQQPMQQLQQPMQQPMQQGFMQQMPQQQATTRCACAKNVSCEKKIVFQKKVGLAMITVGIFHISLIISTVDISRNHSYCELQKLRYSGYQWIMLLMFDL